MKELKKKKGGEKGKTYQKMWDLSARYKMALMAVSMATKNE